MIKLNFHQQPKYENANFGNNPNTIQGHIIFSSLRLSMSTFQCSKDIDEMFQKVFWTLHHYLWTTPLFCLPVAWSLKKESQNYMLNSDLTSEECRTKPYIKICFSRAEIDTWSWVTSGCGVQAYIIVPYSYESIEVLIENVDETISDEIKGGSLLWWGAKVAKVSILRP